MAPRISLVGLKVLLTFLDQKGAGRQQLTGADINKLTKIKSGTLYPLLRRFENAGLLKSEWEQGDPQTLGRPRRRYYALTGEGQRVAINNMLTVAKPAHYGDERGGPAWNF